MKIKNLKEKRLIMARFLVCDKAELNKNRVWEMWNNYWKKDFKIPGHKEMLILKDNKLNYRTHKNDNNIEVLEEYNHIFHKVYMWLEKYVRSHGRPYIEESIRIQRAKQRYDLIDKAKEYKVIQFNNPYKSKELTNYRLIKSDESGKKITKDGTYESLLEFLNQQEENK